MPASHSSIAPSLIDSEEIDLGLKLPVDLDLQPLFPDDRLLRFHPNWFILEFQQDGDLFSAKLKDYASEKSFPLSGSFVFNRAAHELLSVTLEESIEIQISLLNRNNTLHVQISSEQGELEATDPLLLWVRAIREYIRIYLKRTPATLFFRLIMNRMVLQMNPSQRKICLMLAKFTLVEILVIIFIVVGYVIFVL